MLNSMQRMPSEGCYRISAFVWTGENDSNTLFGRNFSENGELDTCRSGLLNLNINCSVFPQES